MTDINLVFTMTPQMTIIVTRRKINAVQLSFTVIFPINRNLKESKKSYKNGKYLSLKIPFTPV